MPRGGHPAGETQGVFRVIGKVEGPIKPPPKPPDSERSARPPAYWKDRRERNS
jgi:hypothetical protein